MDIEVTKRVPFSYEAEQSVLGAILLDGECISEVFEILRPDQFYLKSHRDIYSTMVSMFNQGRPIDAVTLIEDLKAQGIYDEVGKAEYIVKLADSVPITSNVSYYANIVAQKAYIRNLIEACDEISSACYTEEGSAMEIMDMAEQKIYDILKDRTKKSFSTLSELLMEAYDTIELLTDKEKVDSLKILSHFQDLDNLTGGFNNSDLVILAARPGVGKTAFALNIARNVAKYSGKKVCFFSLEMGAQQLATRMLSAEALVDSYKLRNGDIEDEDWIKLAQGCSVLSKFPILVDDNSNITVTEMKAKLRRVNNLGLVIIDYLQLINPGKRSENRVQAVSEITRNLKIMAKDLNVPIITLSQLSRGIESRGENQKPRLSDLRESGSIEQDADSVLFLARDYYADQDDKADENSNIAQCIVAKNRHGATGHIDLQWIPQFTKYVSVETRYDGK